MDRIHFKLAWGTNFMVESKLTFSEEQIQALFGHEAAEDEEPTRLRQYYFKSTVYEQVVNDLSLRILVGHKGIGKSALFQVAIAEEREKKRLAILIKPDDILELKTDADDFLKTIRDWKDGISEIVTRKVIASLIKDQTEKVPFIARNVRSIVDFVKSFISPAAGQFTDDLLVDEFLKTGKVSVYIDDLDRGWEGKGKDVSRISALLNAIRDISSENRSIYFRVSLRSDVYYLVRTSDESTDKIEGSVIWHSWTNHEIFVLLVKRIESFFGRDINEQELLKQRQPLLAHYLQPVFEEKFTGRGHWENAPIYRVLMSLVRKRPRDLVKLCTLAGKNARVTQSNFIHTQNLESVFAEYSQGRLQDTINEFRSELPQIERLLLGMKPSKRGKQTKEGYVYSTDTLIKKLKNIQEQGEFSFSNGKKADSKQLAAFLYKINFITARKESGEEIQRKYFEENRYLSSEFADFGFDWEVHPA